MTARLFSAIAFQWHAAFRNHFAAFTEPWATPFYSSYMPPGLSYASTFRCSAAFRNAVWLPRGSLYSQSSLGFSRS
jgi:hypothetical protein